MNTKMDLVVSFDTTGSMYPCLSQVRRNVEDFINEMFTEFTDLRIGIIAHGDYCDKDDPYTIKYRELSRDAVGLCKFVRNVEQTYGGDADECYELVLNLAHSKELGWREDADKIFIMIGDASPHSPSYRDNKDNLDWREEALELSKLGVKVFSVHALASLRSPSRNFYKKVAADTMGVYLTLEQFSEIIDLIKATVYQQSGVEKLDEFITIIKDNGKMTRTMSNNFKRLKGEAVEEDTYDSYESYSRHSRRVTAHHTTSGDIVIKEMEGLVPVAPSRFQVMTVDENCDIKGFVTKNGIEFKKGRGFYELTKAETVQQYKEVIMQDRETGEMFNGSQVREKLGLQPQSESGGVKEKLHKADAEKFRVFVQSTSVNRKLIKGTTFLYEIPDMEYEGTAIEDKPLPSVPDDVAERMKERAAKEKAEADKAVKETAKKAEADKTAEEKTSDKSVEEKPKTKKKSTPKKKKAKETAVEETKKTVVEETKTAEEKAETVAEESKAEGSETYVDSVDFATMGSTVDVVTATNKELDDLILGKESESLRSVLELKDKSDVTVKSEETSMEELKGLESFPEDATDSCEKSVDETTTTTDSCEEPVEEDTTSEYELSKESILMSGKLLHKAIDRYMKRMIDELKEDDDSSNNEVVNKVNNLKLAVDELMK